MVLRRDKKKVIDEIWDDNRIRSYLNREPADARVHPDHFRLLNAYQAMRPGDFRRFLVIFLSAGGDLNAPDAQDRSIADIIVRHRHASSFLTALMAHGARAPVRPLPEES